MSLEMFIMKCLKYDNSSDMQKIVDKKVKKHYHGCDAAYISSVAFKKLLQTRMELIDNDPNNLHVYIKEIVDELKLRHRKEGPPEKKLKLDVDSCGSNDREKPTIEINKVKNENHFRETAARKLSKMLHCLQKKITKLEEKDVDWDDENDSTYIQLQRYKERAVAVYKKLHQYESGTIPKLPDKRTVTFSGTQFPSVNRAIEKYVNKTGQFPDYQEVLKLFKAAYEEEKIKISPERLSVQARAAFQVIGEQLQRQRQFSAWNAHSYYLSNNKDPAEDDHELQKKLQDNKQQYGNRINEIIDKFAAESKDVVPEEVPDDEAASKSEEDEDAEDDDSEDTNAHEDGGEDNFVDEILAGVGDGESDSSENEKGSSEDSDSDVVVEDQQIKESECNDNSNQVEHDRDVEIYEEIELDKSNTPEFPEKVELAEEDKKCYLQRESPKKELSESVSVSTNLIKVKHESLTSALYEAVASCSTSERPFKLLDRHNGSVKKCESSKNDVAKESSYDSQQTIKHSPEYSAIDTDSDSDVIILE